MICSYCLLEFNEDEISEEGICEFCHLCLEEDAKRESQELAYENSLDWYLH